MHQFGVNKSNLQRHLEKSLSRLQARLQLAARHSSPSIPTLLTTAWTFGSLDLGGARIRSGYVMVALAGDDKLGRDAREVSRELSRVAPEALRKDFFNHLLRHVRGVASSEVATTGVGAGGQPGAGPKPGPRLPNLDQYTVNLTERAKAGKIDPVLGRDVEIRQVDRHPRCAAARTTRSSSAKRASARRRSSRASRSASPQGDVPPPLKNVTVRTLDLALLQAGAGVKGEFENRLKGLIEEVKNSPTPIILFIDEAHTMIGAGGPAGQGDAANLLKPALARGELRTHRGDDVERVQEVLREGSGARASLPAGQGRRAERGGVPP